MGTSDNKGVIVAAVLTPLPVTLTAVCIIIWLHKRQKKRMDLVEKKLENAAYVHSVDNDIPADENGERVMNLLYVSQDNVHEIPEHLLESINLLELPGDSVQFRGIIGKGAFGIVYVGEAHLVNRNPEWTTVAIKTLSESAGEEELSDFLREIELMKDIGEHKNVIQMYGCCTRYRPICLVLEYAKGGNLLNYLRSLKKKCKDIAVARTSEVTKSDKEKYQKFFEEGEMPDDAPSSFPANASDQLEVEENRIKQLEETIPLKVFTSCLRNAMFSFLTVNNFIEHQIQKGFTPNLSGTLEHTAQMTNIINQARIKQRSVVITLLDLKNAFGEVHHNLIQSVLNYHHIPKDVSEIIKSLYTDFNTAFITSEFSTPFITVGRGVLQGDCLSPLIFNFADDAAVISGQDSENQHLLNRFSIWCQWSNMIVKVDKCSTFGIRKSLTKSVQYLPKLLINNELIPATKIGESFRYLGKYFNFSMSEKEHKQELITLMDDIMSEIDLKPLHPKNKLLLYSRYLLSKPS
ncbi:Retrovirus-related Pol poly from type-1 retrotransposable element R2 [Paramuricea clavata]|uniref:Retrovirus-related Pol poly from type-1 retrotransposable element R2 n=1 Tax=Paramuricea clavata TaxID=317549 RepID=A0A7D9DQ32_PARCT|nr:Retrovirus-related Pol poly from type-1 retrotransposable element R2 [Paramuricea clavata]